MNPVAKYAAWRSLAFLLAVGAAIFNAAPFAGADPRFAGEPSTWHDNFARFDYLMDDESFDIQPFKRGPDEKFGIKDPPPGKHRCVVIVPKQAALGNPWSWRGCYWDHQPQVEVELLRRGFHVAYISANATLKPGKQWEAWYAFLTEKHGLSKKPAFVGMSRGGEYAYTWATEHPSEVACIYADNPGVNPTVLKKLGDLAAADVPILHVCGSIDPILARSSGTIESIYQQYGGRISVMIQEGKGHHPHSLRDPKPIADFISQSVQPATSTPPAYLSGRIAKSSFYSLENAYRHFPHEGIYITCRGPWFTDCYDRYSFELKGVQGAVTVIVPRKNAPGKPWTFRADHVGRDAAVDLALLAKGFHIVTGPVPFNGDGPSLKDWNAVYKLLTEHGFSKKPVLEGAGGAAGEAYAWAIANPEKVSCIYAENPVLRCTMTKAQPLDNLGVLAKAGVAMLHVCGSLDPMLQSHTRAEEARCKELGATMTVIVQEGVGHYPTSPKDPATVVDFILRHEHAKPVKPKPTAAPQTQSSDTGAAKALGRSQSGIGQYFQVDYPPSTVEGELAIAVTYTIWVPDGAKKLRGVIVHQHGAGTTASIEGGTAAYDLHWQALAKKWDCALLGPSYHVLHDQNDISPGGSELWFDPRRGSEKAFLKALGALAKVSAHPELEKVPWILWGHSGGGIWADVLSTLHPERVAAMWLRSGSAAQFRTHPEFVRPHVPSACYAIPIMVNPGVKEKQTFKKNPQGLEKGPWWGNLATFREYREQGALIGLAADPRTGHECGDSRYLAIPYLDACMALRLPAPESPDQKLKAVDTSQAWLAPLFGTGAVPAATYRGDIKESVWLPNEAVAKMWAKYARTGAVGDATPPPAPINVRAWPQGAKGELGTEIVWTAEADLESGIRSFIILRDGQELAMVPKTPVGRFGRPLFQSMTYHDTPTQPLPEMRYLDTSAKTGAKHSYEVITVNSVGLKSAPSVKAEPYPRINMSKSYQVDKAWPSRPPSIGWGPMSGVAVDDRDNVWVLSRNDPPVQVYQPDGTFVRAWGEGLLDTPHQLKLDGQGNVWLADSGNHVVLQCTPLGKVIRTLGTPGEAGCDERHFNRPADMVVTPAGDVFVADGYGNARVVHFDKNGKFVKSWGKLGTQPGDFSLPHAIALDSRGRLYVADRNNVRIQVFDQTGKFLEQWQNIVVPCAFWMTKDDELWVCGSSPMTWRAGDRVLGYPPVDQLFMKFNSAGKLLQLWAAPKGEDGQERPGDLNWAHGLALDSRGNIYAVDIKGKRAQKFVLQEPSPQKFSAQAAHGFPDYQFDKTISRQVLENYLARAISMEGLLNGKGNLDDNIRMLKGTGAKFIGRALCLWAGEANLLKNLERARQQLPLVHQADPDMILQACIFEIVTLNVEKVPVPDWALAALGMPVEKRNFRYADMLYPDGRLRDHWRKGASVPDVSRPETKLWFYFLAASYIDLGIEAIHFGQAELMNRNDRDLAHYDEVLGLIRAYAAKHARRHFVVCDAHVPSGGLARQGRLLMDFHSFPLRIKEVPARPQEAILQVGFSDSIYGRSKGGLTYSGWTCEHLPYLVEIDNWGVSRQPGKPKQGGIWVWGYDEISWFANQSKAYRADWLRNTWDWVRKTDANGHLQMPGSRTVRSPLNKRRWYFANAPSAAVPDGLGDEAAIKAIWAADTAR